MHKQSYLSILIILIILLNLYKSMMLVKLVILQAVLFVSLLGRKFETEFKFSLFGTNKGWIYLDKMTFAPGNAVTVLETWTTGLPYGRSRQVFFQAIKQPKWQKEINEQCNNPVRMPLAVHQIKVDGERTTSRIIFSTDDYQIIYFVLKDCQSTLINDYNNSNLILHVKLHMLNNDRQIGEEEDHWYIVPFILFAGMFLVYTYINQYKNQEQFEWSKILMFAGTVTQISSLCWKSFGFLIYLYSGADHYFFHFVYLFLHSTSESSVVALVTLIGFGWTLTYNSGNQFDIFLPIVGALGIINIVITMVTKIGHSHDRHHIFDNVGGNILVGFRLLILLVFIIGCIKTYRTMRHNLKKFMIKFSILGFIYIASTPFIITFANYFILPKNRHEFVFIAVQITKFIVNVTLTYQINSKRSEYNKVNYKNASFLQEVEGFK